MGSKPRHKPVLVSLGRAGSDAAHISELYRDIYSVIVRIPWGRVVTYGQVAELAGRPGAARVVGTALRVSAKELGLPWQRVVGRRSRTRGRVSILDPVGGAVQRLLLEKESVSFEPSGGIDLSRFGWLPVVGDLS